MTPGDHVKSAYLRAMAVDYARAWIGTPYIWGGNDFSGWDCSGFVVEVLQAVGVLAHGLDYSADGLYGFFKPNRVETGYAGCLAFWLDATGHAVHVMLMVDNQRVIGASGGGPGTITEGDAIRQNAFLKMRPIGYRKGIPIIVDPFKAVI